MKLLLRLTKAVVVLGVTFALFAVVAAAGAYYYFAPQLPDIDRLQEVRLQVPLRIFDASGQLLAEFGDQRRIPVPYNEVPPLVIDAFLAAEDDRFFQHPGVDWQGLARAVWALAATGERRQGGSTITMQVARNFFLTPEKTYTRKLIEILLALKIEAELDKDEILELYLNKIYLGQRAYGVAAAAQIYYGLPLSELNLAQAAMIAGLPKAPSRDNPVSNAERAIARRAYVLGRMLATGAIDRAAHDDALRAPITAQLHSPPIAVEAHYVAELVRSELVERFGEDLYSLGLNVYTTIDARMQDTANRALRRALLEYDRRHGWRGPEGTLELAAGDEAERLAALAEYGVRGGLQPALVVSVQKQSAEVVFGDGKAGTIEWEGLSWAQPYRSENFVGPAPKTASDVLESGDVVRVETGEGGALVLAQLPEVQGALVALDPASGGVRALVGGFDFFGSKFNRAVQAERQPGSGFKPFLYTAALDRGYTPATLINDAPIVIDDVSLEGAWRPQNYSRKFFGPTRLREALYRSRNLVSIRLLRDIGIDYALDYVQRFGFDAGQLPRNLSLALGSGVATPLQMARAYSVFANGGYLVDSYFIERIEDSNGAVLFEADPARAPSAAGARSSNGHPAERVVSEDTVYIVRSILADVVQRGTARKASALGRKDLRGKTGTTNDQMDAWFNGFNDRLVATAWVGFDQMKPLGRREAGGVAALPMWMYFFEELLADIPETEDPVPPGIVRMRVDTRSGEPVAGGGAGTEWEYFRRDFVPTPGRRATPGGGQTVPAGGGDPLF